MNSIATLLSANNLPAWQEGEQLEWKVSTKEAKQIVQTVAAFANTRGGVLICGVDDRGAVIGQQLGDTSLREIAQTILANTDERLYPSIEITELEGKSVLVVRITRSALGPHCAYGRPWKRVGSCTVAMDRAEYNVQLAARSNGGGADRDICQEATIADIDEEALYRFVGRANDARNANIPLLGEAEHVLRSLELMRGDSLTIGALLLFGKNPQQFLPQAEIRAAHFADESRAIFNAQRVCHGTLFDQFDAAISFLNQELPPMVDTRIVGNRVIPLFPPAALQELVANAIVHRDYRAPASIFVNIVGKKEIEISNPGLLPAPFVTADTMHTPHPSIPTNRRIARVFFLAGLIEQWGEGARRAYRLLVDANHPAPVWESERGMVRVLLRREG